MSHKQMVGACWPLTKFWRFLVRFELFWGFNGLSKVERKSKRRSRDLSPLFRYFRFWAYVTGMGMLAHGFTHGWAFL
jgi:hypothetical protein